jgi:hypothetical protein
LIFTTRPRVAAAAAAVHHREGKKIKEKQKQKREEKSEEVMSLLTLHGQSALHATNSGETKAREHHRLQAALACLLRSLVSVSQEATN